MVAVEGGIFGRVADSQALIAELEHPHKETA
jgi:hypothetical protein